MKKIVVSFFCIIPLISIGQRFAVIGDFRGGDINAYKVSQLVKSWNPEFIVTTGDNFWYSQGSIDFQIGQFYHEFIFPYNGSYGAGDTINRFFPSLGNHDIESTGLADYLNYFTLPGNERYYDFVKGDIHFFIINSNASEPDGNTFNSVQAGWLENNLSNSNSKFNLVFLHHPPYSSGSHGNNISSQWPYRQWGASAVFLGHDHDYERLLIDSLPYVICGASGSPLYCTFTNYPGTQKFYCSDFGALLAEKNNDSLNLYYYNINDSLIDSFTIAASSSGIKPIENYNNDGQNVLQCFPNPLNNNSSVKYYLFDDCPVILEIYDNSGKKIKTLVDEKQPKGYHQIDLNIGDWQEGVYNIVLTAKNKKYNINTLKIESK